jgi:hypothetical protein
MQINLEVLYMALHIRIILAAVTLMVGIILMVGGIVTGKHGATVGGLCVAVASTQQLIASRKLSREGDQDTRSS